MAERAHPQRGQPALGGAEQPDVEHVGRHRRDDGRQRCREDHGADLSRRRDRPGRAARRPPCAGPPPGRPPGPRWPPARAAASPAGPCGTPATARARGAAWPMLRTARPGPRRWWSSPTMLPYASDGGRWRLPEAVADGSAVDRGRTAAGSRPQRAESPLVGALRGADTPVAYAVCMARHDESTERRNGLYTDAELAADEAWPEAPEPSWLAERRRGVRRGSVGPVRRHPEHPELRPRPAHRVRGRRPDLADPAAAGDRPDGRPDQPALRELGGRAGRGLRHGRTSRRRPTARATRATAPAEPGVRPADLRAERAGADRAPPPTPRTRDTARRRTRRTSRSPGTSRCRSGASRPSPPVATSRAPSR